MRGQLEHIIFYFIFVATARSFFEAFDCKDILARLAELPRAAARCRALQRAVPTAVALQTTPPSRGL